MSELQTGGHDGWFDQHVRRQILKIRPRRIFDVGVGKGLNGKLIRETYLGALGKDIVINGIEIWDKHFEFVIPEYDEIIHGDVREMTDDEWEAFSGDVVIFGDVLEHMDEVEAMQVVRKAYPHFRYIIINTPLGFLEHEEMDGNKWEAHICGLFPENFINKFYIIEQNVREAGTWAGLFNLWIEGGKE